MAIPVLIAAALLTAVTLALIFADLSRGARIALVVIDAALWLFFAIDYVVRFTITPRKRSFLRTQWLDGVLVVIPFLQPLRLGGAVARLARLSAALSRTRRGALLLMGRHKLYLAVAWAAGLVLMASLVTPLVEPESSKLTGFGEGVWWSLVTMTTVGYGDLVPESTAGQVIGVVLMVVGISIIGLVTANVASLLIEPAPDEDDDEVVSDSERLAAIESKLDDLLRRLDQEGVR